MKILGTLLPTVIAGVIAGCSAVPTQPTQSVDASLRTTIEHKHNAHVRHTHDPLPLGFDDGLRAYNAADYDTALRILHPIATEGHPEAQVIIGYMYANGEGVRPDDEHAVSWFRKAAEQGNADGQTNLGFMYATGRGVTMDPGQAMEWYLYAAEQGHAGAQQNLAAFLGGSRATWNSPQGGFDIMRSRAEKGDRDAMRVLGESYLTGTGVRQDTEIGLEWIKKAASVGSAAAQFRLGKLITSGGHNMQKDRVEGVIWIEKAADQGYLSAIQWIEENGED